LETTLRQVTYYESRRKRSPRFHILVVHADVADVRTRKRDDLAGVGRVGQDFLITRHRRVEHDFSYRMAARADGDAAENRPIGEGQDRRPRHCPASAAMARRSWGRQSER
jgi:hypothetical protein